MLIMDEIAGPDDVVLRIDGAEPVSAATVEQVVQACDRIDAAEGRGRLLLYATGAPDRARMDGLTVGAVSKWERAVRRLERLPAVTAAVVDGDCGGPALDAVLATDHRVGTGSPRLIVPVAAGATWPGMALLRLVQQAGGTGAVRRAALFGTPLTGEEALGLGLLDAVTDDVAGALADLAALTAGLSGPELAIRRQLLADAVTTGFEEALGVHLATCDRMLRQASKDSA